MTEATGFEAKTVYRLVEVDPKSGGFKRDDDNPLNYDLPVVDETSMGDASQRHAGNRADTPQHPLREIRRSEVSGSRAHQGRVGDTALGREHARPGGRFRHRPAPSRLWSPLGRKTVGR